MPLSTLHTETKGLILQDHIAYSCEGDFIGVMQSHDNYLDIII